MTGSLGDLLAQFALLRTAFVARVGDLPVRK
jgi:hypothetical protein